jgi:hypothetical protein
LGGDLLDRSPSTICEHFTDLHELIKLKKEEFARKSLKKIYYTLITMESSSGKKPMKKAHKEKMEAQIKGKILDNIVPEKEDKGFDAKECCIVVETIREEYDVCFPFGIALLPNVEIEVLRFK